MRFFLQRIVKKISSTQMITEDSVHNCILSYALHFILVLLFFHMEELCTLLVSFEKNFCEFSLKLLHIK